MVQVKSITRARPRSRGTRGEDGPPVKGGAPAVERAIVILRAVAAGHEALSLSALTDSLSLPKSSVLGICNTLVKGGLLRRTPEKTYRLGMGLVDLARNYLETSNPVDHFIEAWNSLEKVPEETVVLSVLEGTEVVYVACRNGTRGLSFNYRIGMRLPASCTASGKALLSTLPQDAVANLFHDPLPQLTTRSAARLADLRRDLNTARQRGYAVDREETREGMCCIGAPVFTLSGRPATAAVAVSMLTAEFRSGQRQHVIDTVMTLARRLSDRLGARPLAMAQPIARPTARS